MMGEIKPQPLRPAEPVRRGSVHEDPTAATPGVAPVRRGAVERRAAPEPSAPPRPTPAAIVEISDQGREAVQRALQAEPPATAPESASGIASPLRGAPQAPPVAGSPRTGDPGATGGIRQTVADGVRFTGGQAVTFSGDADLRVEGEGTVHFSGNGNLTLTGSGTVRIEGNVHIQVKGDARVEVSDGVLKDGTHLRLGERAAPSARPLEPASKAVEPMRERLEGERMAKLKEKLVGPGDDSRAIVDWNARRSESLEDQKRTILRGVVESVLKVREKRTDDLLRQGLALGHLKREEPTPLEQLLEEAAKPGERRGAERGKGVS